MTSTMTAYRKRMALFHERLGGSCSKCGSKIGLEIHHRNPEEKSFTISVSWSLSLDVVLRELEKCVLLCVDCHAAHHLNLQHGTSTGYRRGCRCLGCTNAQSKRVAEYRSRVKGKDP